MPGVFISHAFADKVIVGPFVDDIIKLGCGVPPEKIFYSSGADTGLSSGDDLLAQVRQQVGDASIVVAIVSPTFQTRPVCVAELGAAWSRVDNLFPIAVPGMDRPDLEGVLVGMLVKYLDDGAALDELHTRVTKAVGTSTTAQTWNQYREKWLASVGSYAAKLETPKAVSSEAFEQLSAQLEGTRAALQQSEAERLVIAEKLQSVAAAKSAAEVAEILLPEDEIERFEELKAKAASAVGKLPAIVGEAIWYSLFDGGMPRPDYYEDKTRLDEAEEAKRDGFLYEGASSEFEPDDSVKAVDEALRTVRTLHTMLGETTVEFDEWFHDKYALPPDLGKRLVWNKLIATQRLWR